MTILTGLSIAACLSFALLIFFLACAALHMPKRPLTRAEAAGHVASLLAAACFGGMILHVARVIA